MLATATPVLLFLAFLLLLLVSLSVPITKTIYLFELLANVRSGVINSSVSGNVKFGVWGYCFSGVDVSVLGSQHDTAAECSKAKLGYTFDQTIGSALHVSGFENLISRTLTAVLVLNPVACGLTFLAFIISLALIRHGYSNSPRVASLFTLVVGTLAGLITTIILLIDIGLVASVRSKVKKDTSGDLQLNWGNAVWMVLGAALAIWASLIGACASVCSGRRNIRKPETY